MIERQVWPATNNPIKHISYSLVTGFNAQGNPEYTSGSVVSPQDRQQVQALLAPLQPVERSVASVTMGEVNLELEDGNIVTLQPVYHPSLDLYRDLFIADEGQYPLPPALAEILNRWRRLET